MKNLLFLFLFGTLYSCSQQSRLNKVEYFFAPSFQPQSKFTIDLDSKTIRLHTFYLARGIDFENTQDTLMDVFNETFEINEPEFSRFLKDFNSIKLDSSTVNQVSMLDGIGYKVSRFFQKNDSISLTSNLIERDEESTLEYEFLDAFFELSYKTITDYNGVVIIENIHDYFSYGLPIKKVDNHSMEYRIWGSISGCREDNQELIKFLKSLPDDKNVLFDLRNGSIAYCLNEVLEEFSKKKLIYFYGDKSAIRSKEIMDEIKLAEKNGEVLSSLRISAYETHKRIYEDWVNNQKIKSFLTKEEVLEFISKSKKFNI